MQCSTLATLRSTYVNGGCLIVVVKEASNLPVKDHTPIVCEVVFGDDAGTTRVTFGSHFKYDSKEQTEALYFLCASGNRIMTVRVLDPHINELYCSGEIDIYPAFREKTWTPVLKLEPEGQIILKIQFIKAPRTPPSMFSLKLVKLVETPPKIFFKEAMPYVEAALTDFDERVKKRCSGPAKRGVLFAASWLSWNETLEFPYSYEYLLRLKVFEPGADTQEPRLYGETSVELWSILNSGGKGSGKLSMYQGDKKCSCKLEAQFAFWDTAKKPFFLFARTMTSPLDVTSSLLPLKTSRMSGEFTAMSLTNNVSLQKQTQTEKEPLFVYLSKAVGLPVQGRKLAACLVEFGLLGHPTEAKEGPDPIYETCLVFERKDERTLTLKIVDHGTDAILARQTIDIYPFIRSGYWETQVQLEPKGKIELRLSKRKNQGPSTKLRVRILGAVELVAEDLLKEVEPFAEVALVSERGGVEKKKTKKSKRPGCNPIWDEVLEFDYKDQELIRFRVEDQNLFAENELIGEASHKLSSLLYQGAPKTSYISLAKEQQVRGQLKAELELRDSTGAASSQDRKDRPPPGQQGATGLAGSISGLSAAESYSTPPVSEDDLPLSSASSPTLSSTVSSPSSMSSSSLSSWRKKVDAVA